MGIYKICVYAICKNEENFVDRWMDSMGEADMVVVTDTGSADGTVERLRERGAVVYIDIIQPWRFDVARNTSLDHVPEEWTFVSVPILMKSLNRAGGKNWKRYGAVKIHLTENPLPGEAAISTTGA